MDKKGAKNRSSRPKSLRKTRARISSRVVQSMSYALTFIADVKQFCLSDVTQQGLSIVYGTDLNEENPWLFVDKHRIMDYIDLYEEDSELLSIYETLEAYPEKEILVGCFRNNFTAKLTYFFCLSVEAKKTVLDMIYEKETLRYQETLCKVHRIPGYWSSLGSEAQVESDMIKNLRPLFKVEIHAKFPMDTENIKFKMEYAQDIKNGYSELVSNRYIFKNILRKKLDRGTQTQKSMISQYCQTKTRVLINKWTQYDISFIKSTFDEKTQKPKLIKYLKQRFNEVHELLLFNAHINLYTNDYLELPNQIHKTISFVPHDIVQFREPIKCKNKIVSVATWHPLISGVLAVGYSKYPNESIVQKEVDTSESGFSTNYVLIWSYWNCTLPRLSLCCPRSICSLSFCPYSNILLGGCNNGQMIIWDLENKLVEKNKFKLHSEKQMQNYLIMEHQTNWFKKTDKRVIEPTAISAIETSHRDSVTGIKWFDPGNRVDTNGKFRLKTEDEPNVLQFLTCGLDGKLMIWDLRTIPKTGFFDNIGNKLDAASPLRSLHTKFQPFYEIRVRYRIKRTGELISTMSFPDTNYNYVALNPETLPDKMAKTFFKYEPLKIIQKLKSRVYVGTQFGSCLRVSWEGNKNETGFSMTREIGNYSPGLTIHDGPIVSMRHNPVNPDIVLTVGGRVFAIWDGLDMKKPILWRKCKVKYISAIWATRSIFTCINVRLDSFIEIWNMAADSKHPVYLIRCSGNTISAIYSELETEHVRKGTFILADIVGAVRVYNIPSATSLMGKYTTEAANIVQVDKKLMLETILKRLKHIYDIKVTKGVGKSSSPEVAKNDPEENFKDNEIQMKGMVELVSKLVRKSGKERFENLQEKRACRTLLERKHINIAEVEMNRIPMLNLMNTKKGLNEKIAILFSKKEEIFKERSHKIFPFQATYDTRRTITVDMPDSLRANLKKTYLEEYKSMEKDVLRYVTSCQYKYNFNWGNLLLRQRATIRKLTNSYIIMSRVSTYFDSGTTLTGSEQLRF